MAFCRPPAGRISHQHHPSQYEPAMAVCPSDRQQRQRPPAPPEFQQRHEHRHTEKTDHPRTIGRERRHYRGRRARRRNARTKAAGQSPRQISCQPTHRRQQQHPDDHDARKARSGIHGVHQDLAQPLVRQVEPLHLRLVRVFCLRGICERIRNRKRAVLRDVLPGLQMPPEIRVRNLGSEHPHEAGSREQQCGRLQPSYLPPPRSRYGLAVDPPLSGTRHRKPL